MQDPARKSLELDKDHERVLAELEEILVAKLLVLLKRQRLVIRTTLNEEVVPARTKFTQKMLEGYPTIMISITYGWTGEAPVDDDVRMVGANSASR